MSKKTKYGQTLGPNAAAVALSEIRRDNPTLILSAEFHLARIREEHRRLNAKELEDRFRDQD